MKNLLIVFALLLFCGMALQAGTEKMKKSEQVVCHSADVQVNHSPINILDVPAPVTVFLGMEQTLTYPAVVNECLPSSGFLNTLFHPPKLNQQTYLPYSMARIC